VATAAKPRSKPLEFIRQAAVVVFSGLIVFSVFVPARAGRAFWTVSVASLPLVFVIAGYHRWREICPLAFFSQLPTRFGRAGRRRASTWLQEHGYEVSFGVFVTSLWLRLIATNGDGYALAAFLSLLSIGSLVIGLVFTGKSWCHYVCPVSFVEKIYTEPRNLREAPNSQCQKCTACKPACSDINEENSYWKDVLLPAKRHAYFAFPGVIFAFYFYFFLQSGTWEYYFGGSWTREVGLVRTAFLPGSDAHTAGLWFLPAVPRAAAALVTLLLGAAVSLTAFSLAERPIGRWLRSRDQATDDANVRHMMFTIAAFTAFVTFYSFAGAPTLRLVPGLPHAFQVIVVTTATLFLLRRLTRRQSAFAEETLARRIIAQWPWKDAPPPRDLREAFLVHTVRSQSQEEARTRALALYKSSVRDSVASGVISRNDVHRLDAIRNQMRISESDHERVMAELAEEDGGLARAVVVSPEKHLQLETYAQALAVHLDRQRQTGAVDTVAIRTLREEFAVTEEEHAAVLDRMVQSDGGIGAHLIEAPAAIETAIATAAALEALRSPAARFLAVLLRRRAERAADGLLQTLGGSEGLQSIRAGLVAADADARTSAVAALGTHVSPATAARLVDAHERARQALSAKPPLVDALRSYFTCPDPYVRAATLYALESLDEVVDADYTALEHDEHPLVQELVESAQRLAAGRTILAEPTALSKMIGLKSIGMFDGLEPEDLAQLARAGRESWFTNGEPLCREGEIGDEVFVLLTGEVSILRHTAAGDEVVGIQGPGTVIGELAVLDPAPRQATVVASTVAVRALRLAGASFRRALNASPAVSEVIIRMLARRLRAQEPGVALRGDGSSLR